MFSRFRRRLAEKRLEKALNNCTLSDFRRALALQEWFDSTRLVPGDKIVLSFDGEHHLDVISADTISNPIIKEWKKFNED